jgi:hypothetical protein
MGSVALAPIAGWARPGEVFKNGFAAELLRHTMIAVEGWVARAIRIKTVFAGTFCPLSNFTAK